MPSDNGSHELLDWSDKQRFRKIFADQAERAYLYLSLGTGLIAASLPILLLIAGGYAGNWSISHFYHVPGDASRNILVGSLCATGAFMFLFHGLTWLENWILNLGGAAAISIAMNPAPKEQCAGGELLTVHTISACTFFVCLAVVAVALAKGRVRYIIYPPKRRFFVTAYTITGIAMLALPAAVVAIHFLSQSGCESHWVFWFESCAIWAFSAFWFVKTAEYRLLLGIHWFPRKGGAAD